MNNDNTNRFNALETGSDRAVSPSVIEEADQLQQASTEDQSLQSASRLAPPNEVYPWFVIYVKTHHEKSVARSLRSKSYTEFLPLYRGRRRQSGLYHDVELPLFPNYVFCRFPPNKRLPILQTPGVFHIIGTSRGPEPLSDAEVRTIHKILGSGLLAQPWPFLNSGDRVRIVEGPLKGCEGIVENSKGQCRLIVSISMLQRSVAVDVDRRWVRPISVAHPGLKTLQQMRCVRSLDVVQPPPGIRS